jgi:Na+/H+ antiporter NhaC
MWGKIINVMLPIAVLAASSLIIRSVIGKSFAVDSACGLVATLLFMFILYSWQGLMTPEQFVEHLIAGIANTTMPIIMYLLTICFSTLLDNLNMHEYITEAMQIPGDFAFLFPAVLFLISMFLTILFGSSWSMYALVFPIAIRLIPSLDVNMILCIGAISAAGIAGEKNCLFTADALTVGTAIGCNPEEVLKVRMTYGVWITVLSALLYLIVGFFVH